MFSTVLEALDQEVFSAVPSELRAIQDHLRAAVDDQDALTREHARAALDFLRESTKQLLLDVGSSAVPAWCNVLLGS